MWLAAPDRYAAWDRYVTSEAEGQPYGLALTRGRELANIDRFRLREADPRLERAVATGVGLYRASGEPRVPAVLLPAAVLQGHVPDLATLFRLLDANLPRAVDRRPAVLA